MFKIKISQYNFYLMRKFLVNNIRGFCNWQQGIKRAPFNELNEEDVNYFKSILPKHSVVTDTEELKPHNICFVKLVEGRSKLLLCPGSTE